MSRLTQKQKEFLVSLEKLPERGDGLHDYTMGLCNRGINAGFTADQLYEILEPLRPWHPNELESTIQKAEEEAPDWQSGESLVTPALCVSKRDRSRKTEADAAGQILEEDPERAASIRNTLIQSVGGEIDPFGPEVRAASNPSPDIIPAVKGMVGSEFASGMISFLQVAYHPDDLLFIGEKKMGHEQQRAHIKPAGEWIDFFSDNLAAIKEKPRPATQMRLLMSLGYSYPAFCINPLTGEADEKGSFRSSGCIKEFRYLLLESDGLPLNQQIPVLAGLGLPVVAMTFSGSRSIHGLIKVEDIPGVGFIENLADWKTKMKSLFAQLVPLGFDGATKDPVRLSRLPGIWRNEKNKIQQLLYLNQNGGIHV